MSMSDLTYGKENHGYKTQNKLLYKICTETNKYKTEKPTW